MPTRKPKKRTPTNQDPFQVHKPQLLRAADLNPVAYNPNKMSPEQFEALRESIRLDGFIDPLVVQKDGLNIIGGHHRLRAIKELCIEAGVAIPKIPCVVLPVTDNAAKRLNLKLNHIKGDPDARLLGELLADLYPTEMRLVPTEFDVQLLGFAPEDAIKYIKVADPEFSTGPGVGDENPPGFGRSITLGLEFDSIKLRDKVRKILVDRTALEKKKTGDIVADMLGIGRKAKPRKASKGRARATS